MASVPATHGHTPSNVSEAEIFEGAFRHAAIGKALVSIDGTFIKVNDALCRMLGYPRESLLKTGFQQITHPHDLERDLALVQRLLEGDLESYDLEKRYFRMDGEVIWGLLTVTLAKDASGLPRFFVAQIQDITARRRAESDIARFFDTSPDLLAIAGKSGRLEVVSRSWERTLGWTREELTTRDFIDFVHPDDRARTIAEAGNVYAGRPSPGFRNRYLTRDGHHRWLEWNSTQSDDGRLFCVVRDITESVEAERARTWLAAVVNHSSDAIIGVDVSGAIFSWNRGAELLFGYGSDEVRGKRITLLAPDPATQANVEAVVQRARGGEALQEYDAVRRRKDGSLVDVHVHVRRVEAEDGSTLGWSVTARDISERRRINEVLARQAAVYAAIASSLPRGCVTVFDPDLRWVVAEGAELLELIGTSREQLIGRHVAETSSPENRPRLEAVYRRALAGESIELEAERAGRALLMRVAPLHGTDGTITGGLVLSLDVTAQRTQAEELRRAKLLLEAAIANVDDGLAMLDSQRRMLHWNDAYLRLLGLEDQADRLHRSGPQELFELIGPRCENADPLAARLLGPAPVAEVTDELVLRAPVRRVLRRTIKPVGVGGEGGYLVIWRDVTPEHDLLAQRARDAETDALTGILNRRGAERALQAALSDRRPTSVALFDVDHFKRINDQFGHPVGDRVLRAVAEVLAAEARGSDVVARWGGEEFLALLEGPPSAAAAYADRVRRAVKALKVEGLPAVTLSAGVAAAGDGTGIAAADQWLYRAKAEGRDRVMPAP